MAFHKAVCFICADDLCIPTQDASFEKTETTFSDALDSIGEYYNRNHLRANPRKDTDMRISYPKQRSQPKAEHLVMRPKKFEHIPTPIYLGVNLDRTTQLHYSHRKGSKRRLQQETMS